jgi:hypothetical protein
MPGINPSINQQIKGIEMAKYDQAPVQELKIKMIKDILNHPTVNFYYFEWLRLKYINAPHKEIDIAFRSYAKQRDLIGGLPPMVPMLEKKPNLRIY